MEDDDEDGDENDGEEEPTLFDWRAHVEDLEKKGTNSAFKCSYCVFKITGGRTRLMEHFLGALSGRPSVRRCASCPEDVREAASAVRASESTTRARTESLIADRAKMERDAKRARLDELSSRLGSRSSTPCSKTKQLDLDDMTRASLLDSAQQMVSRFLFGAGLPFDIVRNVHFVNALDAVCE